MTLTMERGQVVVRAATMADKARVLAMLDVYGGCDYLGAIYEANLGRPHHYMILVEVDGTVVGFGGCYVMDNQTTLFNFAGRTSTDHRGEGLLHAMTADVKSVMRNHYPDLKYTMGAGLGSDRQDRFLVGNDAVIVADTWMYHLYNHSLAEFTQRVRLIKQAVPSHELTPDDTLTLSHNQGCRLVPNIYQFFKSRKLSYVMTELIPYSPQELTTSAVRRLVDNCSVIVTLGDSCACVNKSSSVSSSAASRHQCDLVATETSSTRAFRGHQVRALSNHYSVCAAGRLSSCFMFYGDSFSQYKIHLYEYLCHVSRICPPDVKKIVYWVNHPPQMHHLVNSFLAEYLGPKVDINNHRMDVRLTKSML